MEHDHRLSSVEKNLDDERCRASCACGWRSGWRMDHASAVRGVGDHIDQQAAVMTEAKSEALLRDCAHGLHEEFDGGVDGCQYPECRDAFFYRDDLQAERAYAAWMSRETKRAKLR